jgi:hypothetical protein
VPVIATRAPRLIFVWITLGFIVGGAAIAQAYRLLFAQSLLDMVASAPGGAGDVLVFVLQAGPLILFGLCAFVPTLYVRAVRRRACVRSKRICRWRWSCWRRWRKPGLGFDAALARIVKSQGSDRPLVTEFVNFSTTCWRGCRARRRCVSLRAASMRRRSRASRRR